MKAKSWKKFVAKNEEEKQQESRGLSDIGFNTSGVDSTNGSSTPSLDSLLPEDSSLRGLMAERDKLEKEMANLTGGTIGGNARQGLGEIASHQTKKKRDEAWARKREELVKRKGRGSREELYKENIDALKPPVNDKRFDEKQENDLKKFGDVNFVGSSNDYFDYNKERNRVNDDLKQQEIERRKLEHSNDDFESDEDRFKRKARSSSRAGKKTSDDYFRGVKGSSDDWLAKRDKVNESLRKLRDKTDYNPIDKVWDKNKEEIIGSEKLKSMRSKYEEKKKRLLSVVSGSLTQLGEKSDRLKQLGLQKKKDERRQEKKEEEKREKKREERKEQRKEERKRKKKK